MLFALGLVGEEKETPRWPPTLLMMSAFPPMESAHITDAGNEVRALHRASVVLTSLMLRLSLGPSIKLPYEVEPTRCGTKAV